MSAEIIYKYYKTNFNIKFVLTNNIHDPGNVTYLDSLD